MKSPLSIQIDRERGLYHYYKSKPDLLSKCKAEVHKAKLEELKKKSAIKSYQEKVNRFIEQYPHYKETLKGV